MCLFSWIQKIKCTERVNKKEILKKMTSGRTLTLRFGEKTTGFLGHIMRKAGHGKHNLHMSKRRHGR